MPHCAVYGCRNNSRYKHRDPSIRFHSFPSNESLRERWIKFCGRSFPFNVKTAAVCSTHFSEDQKQKSMMNRLLGTSPSNARNLVPDAVPNINTPQDLETLRISMKMEREKQASMEPIVEIRTDSFKNTTMEQTVESEEIISSYSPDSSEDPNVEETVESQENSIIQSLDDLEDACVEETVESEENSAFINQFIKVEYISMEQIEIDNEVMSASNSLTLFDFTTLPHLNDWIEISDTKRDVGMSKASFVLQKTQKFQRAVFFTMLNPQPNGAGFAGVSSRSTFNLENYSNIEMHARAQGSVSDYKIVLRHKGLNDEPHPTYEQFFTMPMNEFTTISLPLSDFDPYFRGRKLNSSEAEPLDKSQISSFGFQVYGGVYHPKKQSGISAFEVDWVKAS